LYYKACTKYFPIDAKLLHTASFFHTASFYTQHFKQRSFDTKKAFTHGKFLHTEGFSHSKLLEKEVFTQRSSLVTPKPDLGAKAKKGRF